MSESISHATEGFSLIRGGPFYRLISLIGLRHTQR